MGTLKDLTVGFLGNIAIPFVLVAGLPMGAGALGDYLYEKLPSTHQKQARLEIMKPLVANSNDTLRGDDKIVDNAETIHAARFFGYDERMFSDDRGMFQYSSDGKLACLSIFSGESEESRERIWMPVEKLQDYLASQTPQSL